MDAIIQRAKYVNSTNVDQNFLSTLLLTQPMVLPLVMLAIGSNADNYGILQYLVAGSSKAGSISDGGFEAIGSNKIRWGIVGGGTRAMPIAGAATPTPNTGLNFTEFLVPFYENYWSVGDVCNFEDGNQARVMREPTVTGSLYTYAFRIMGNSVSAFISAEALEVGKMVGWSHTAFEEGSIGGGAKSSTGEMYDNQMIINRMAYTFTGGAATDNVVNITFPTAGANNKPLTLWLFEQQWTQLKNFVRQRERSIWDSRSTSLADGTSPVMGSNGRPVQQGNGICAQLSQNVFHTPALTEDLMETLAVSLYSKSGEGREGGKTLCVTGFGGYREFQKLLNKLGRNVQVVDTQFVTKEGNKLKFGNEWVTYRGLFGNEFTIVNAPMLNDKSVYTKLIGPHGYTERSYDMHFLDTGEYNGKPNINILAKGAGKKNRSFLSWWTGGAVTPEEGMDGDSNGKGNFGPMRSTGEDACTVWMLSEYLVQIQNPYTGGIIKIRP